MYKFNIKGYKGDEKHCYDTTLIDITVFAETQTEAISKAESILGHTISTLSRAITITEIIKPEAKEWQLKRDCDDRELVICPHCNKELLVNGSRFHFLTAWTLNFRYCPLCGKEIKPIEIKELNWSK